MSLLNRIVSGAGHDVAELARYLRTASMSEEALKGWHAFRQMVGRQRDALG